MSTLSFHQTKVCWLHLCTSAGAWYVLPSNAMSMLYLYRHFLVLLLPWQYYLIILPAEVVSWPSNMKVSTSFLISLSVKPTSFSSYCNVRITSDCCQSDTIQYMYHTLASISTSKKSRYFPVLGWFCGSNRYSHCCSPDLHIVLHLLISQSLATPDNNTICKCMDNIVRSPKLPASRTQSKN